MAQHPNQGGSSNRQGPGPSGRTKKGLGALPEWTLTKGAKASKAGTNMGGHSWHLPAPSAKGDGGNAYGGKKSPKYHNPHPR